MEGEREPLHARRSIPLLVFFFFFSWLCRVQELYAWELKNWDLISESVISTTHKQDFKYWCRWIKCSKRHTPSSEVSTEKGCNPRFVAVVQWRSLSLALASQFSADRLFRWIFTRVRSGHWSKGPSRAEPAKRDAAWLNFLLVERKANVPCSL